MKSGNFRYFSTDISKEQSKDSGMAVVLILLFTGFFTHDFLYFKLAIGALLMNMVFPMFYYPFAIFWFGIGNLLGIVGSKILLSLIFLVIVVPVALIRQLMGKDPLKLKMFKKCRETVMKKRNYRYRAGDLENPF